MLIGSNEACAVLAQCGLGRRHAQQALVAGLAGEPRRLRSRVLYDRDRVRELAARPQLGWSQLVELCPDGVFVSRRPVTVTDSRAEMVAALSGGWGELSPWKRVAMQLQIEVCGSLPLVATLAGFVVLGADVVAVRGFDRFVMTEPGAWFERLVRTQLRIGPGRSWVLHLGPVRAVPEHGRPEAGRPAAV